MHDYEIFLTKWQHSGIMYRGITDDVVTYAQTKTRAGHRNNFQGVEALYLHKGYVPHKVEGGEYTRSPATFVEMISH